MRATLLALALLAAGAAGAQAPAPATAANHEARMMNDLAKLLDLTAAQRPQVQSILQEQHTQMQQQHAQMKEAFEQAKAAGTKPDFSQMKAQHQQLEQHHPEAHAGAERRAAAKIPDPDEDAPRALPSPRTAGGRGAGVRLRNP
jgi:Spy/CpxP family protein refolding chaperone